MRKAVGLLVAVAMAVAACSGGTSHPSSSGATGPLTAAEQKYGLAPDPHADVTYQPDVVVVGGGANSVRSADADGLTFTLDPSAPHVKELAIGKVMVLTDQSSGRILDIQHTAAGVVVTLAPVPLGEVFKNAHLTFNVPISPDQLTIDPDPGPAGDVAENLPAGGALTALEGTALTTDGNPEPTSTTSPPTATQGALAGAPTPALLMNASTPGSTSTTTSTTRPGGGGAGGTGGGAGGGGAPGGAGPTGGGSGGSGGGGVGSPSSGGSGSGGSGSGGSNSGSPGQGNTGPGGSSGSGGGGSGTPGGPSPSGGGGGESGGGGVGGLSGGFFGEAFGSYGSATGFGGVDGNPCPSGGDQPVPPPSVLQPFENASGPTFSPALEAKVSNWNFEAERLPGQITFRGAYVVAGLKLGVVFRLFFTKLTMTGSDDIVNGHETPSAISLAGINRVAIGLVGGSGTGVDGNIRTRVDIPINLEVLTRQLFVDGIPLVVAAKPKFIIETAFSAKNSVIQTCGDYNLNLEPLGPAEAPVVKFFQATKSLLPINGISIGVNGVVLAFEVKFQAGFGVKVAYAGPFATFDVAVGVTRGSDIGLVTCQSADLVVSMKAGVGLSIDGNTLKFITPYLPRWPLAASPNLSAVLPLANLAKKLGYANSFELDNALYATTLYKAHKAIPNIPLCTS